MQPAIKTFCNKQAVADAFATDLVELLQSLTKSQARVTVSLSGGSTPKLLFALLANSFKNAVDWTRVHFYWGDERCVPPTDPESNYGEAHKLFLSRIEIPDGNIHRIEGESDPVEERVRYSRVISETVDRNLHGIPVFDILILGMGEDGHAASIFPHEIQFLKSDLVCEIATHPLSGQHRITVTGKIINASRHVFFLVTGEGKADVLAEILHRTGKYDSYPASHVSPPGGLTFYLDQAAAEKLE